jgi:hypothetical protein
MSAVMSCSFGCLAENHCEARATWRSPDGSGWCEEHKPTWHADLSFLGSAPTDEDILFPNGGRPHRRGIKPIHSNWSRDHAVVV